MRHVLAFLILAPALEAAAPAFEAPPVLHTRDLLPSDLREGKGFRVEDEVPTDGWTARFTLRSGHGTFEAAGREMLEVRIAELPALDRLAEVRRTDVFAQAAKRAALSPVRAVGAVVDDPVGTARGVPAGVGRFFKRTFRKVRRGVDDVKDAKADRDARKAGEADETPEAGAFKGEVSPDDPEKSAGAKAGGVAKDVFGWSRARRQWARQLQVDPYTTNPVLAKELDEVAWAAFAGGFVIGVVVPPLPGPVTTVTRMSDLVWELPPADIEARNEKRLKAMGLDGRPMRDLFRNDHFTPTLSLPLVDAVEALQGVGGREEVVELAAGVGSQEEARFLLRAAEMLVRVNAERPLARLFAVEGALAARTRAGGVLLPVPDDCLSWTEEVAEFVGDRAWPSGRRELRLAGQASPRAREELARRGWTLRESVRP